MTNGVVYQFTGDRHAAVLAVSLWTLRKHYDGPVTILVGDDAAWTVAHRIVADHRLGGVALELCCFAARTDKNFGYANKTLVPELSPYDRTIFLDADTTIHGPLDALWPREDEFVLTTFGDWVSNDGIMRGRIEKWREFAPTEVACMLQRPWPAINTGVFAFTKRSTFSAAWKEMTHRNLSFICDEIAAQLIFPFQNRRLVDDAYNWSPRYGVSTLPFIVHQHGKKHVREPGLSHWWPCFVEAFNANAGGLQDWCPAGDKRLGEYLAANPATLSAMSL